MNHFVKTYNRRNLSGAKVTHDIPFNAFHYLPMTPGAGIPHAVALKLVNDWNRVAIDYKYWID